MEKLIFNENPHIYFTLTIVAKWKILPELSIVFCWEAFKHQGPERPYEGNYINKTWNTDEDKKDPNYIPVVRAAVYQGWLDGVYDLTWHCLKCHAQFLGRPHDLKRVEQKMRLWQFATERKKHKWERHQKGFW